MDVSQASRPIKFAAALVVAQAFALLCVAIGVLISLDSDRLGMDIVITMFYLLAGAGVAFSAWGLLNLRRWSRGPVVLIQLIQLGLAWELLKGSQAIWLVVALAVVAIAVLLVVFAPSTTQALYGYGDEPTTQSDDDGVKG